MAKKTWTKSAKAAPKKVYVFKVTLLHVAPPIWRHIQVGDCTLDQLHEHIQNAMGWTNSHLHQFICGEHMYADAEAQLEQYEGDPPVLDERNFTLAELLPEVHQGLVYEYDFGDSWEHIVTVEKILPVDASTPAGAVCLAGSRACPPEDCGGIGGGTRSCSKRSKTGSTPNTSA